MVHGQKKLKRVAIGSVVTLVLALIIAVLTLAPMTVGGPAGSDKLYHILAFAGLAFPLPLVRPRLTLWVVVGVISYGGAIELIQPFFNRQAEWADLAADGIGAILGAVVARQLGLWLRRSGESNDKDDPMTEAWLSEDAAIEHLLHNDVVRSYGAIESSPEAIVSSGAALAKEKRRRSR